MEGLVSGGGRWRAIALAGMCAGLVGGCGSSDDGQRVDTVPALGFVERFAPVVHLHPDERYRPLSVPELVERARFMWSHGVGRGRETIAAGVRRRGARDGARVLRLRTIGSDDGHVQVAQPREGCAECGQTTYSTASRTRPFTGMAPRLRDGEGFYLDLPDGWTGPDGRRGGPVYTEVVEEESGRRVDLRVTYWLLFAANAPAGAPSEHHQGDWERVSVLLRRVDGGARYRPLSVRYYQYDGGVDVPWAEAPVVDAGPGEGASHPEAFLSKGDHTPYPGPVSGTRALTSDGESVPLQQEATTCDRCPRLSTWRSLVNADTQPWYGFGGAWGAIGSDEASTGPGGPSAWPSEPDVRG